MGFKVKNCRIGVVIASSIQRHVSTLMFSEIASSAVSFDEFTVSCAPMDINRGAFLLSSLGVIDYPVHVPQWIGRYLLWSLWLVRDSDTILSERFHTFVLICSASQWMNVSRASSSSSFTDAQFAFRQRRCEPHPADGFSAGGGCIKDRSAGDFSALLLRRRTSGMSIPGRKKAGVVHVAKQVTSATGIHCGRDWSPDDTPMNLFFACLSSSSAYSRGWACFLDWWLCFFPL